MEWLLSRPCLFDEMLLGFSFPFSHFLSPLSLAGVIIGVGYVVHGIRYHRLYLPMGKVARVDGLMNLLLLEWVMVEWLHGLLSS